MKTKILIFLCLMLSPSIPANAREIMYSKSSINVRKLLVEMESATGLLFEVKCDSCVTNGGIGFSNGVLKVVVYEQSDPTNPHISPVDWTESLGNTITAIVNAHTP